MSVDSSLQSDSSSSISDKSEKMQDESPLHPIVVGIGASAGGLKALQGFFEALPADTGMSFVVIMHLSPQHESNLAELLQAKTRMPVTQVTETVTIDADHIYVIPPSKRLEATDRELSIHEFDEPRGRRAPIDLFFRSLAEVHGRGAGIILSGSGTDGCVGIRAIKEAGGLVLVQDPAEAEFDSMPRSAIETGVADGVLPVHELAAELVNFVSSIGEMPEMSEPATNDKRDPLRDILARVLAVSGHDFSRYKRSTVVRRLQRRLVVTRHRSPEDYLSFIMDNPDEVDILFKELLISVTSFFRDPSSFDALKETVIPKLFEGKDATGTVRAWVAGCATGEEAYSVAILLHEYVETQEIRPKIQVFATDLDVHALAKARDGRYPASIEADVSQERLNRFFTRDDSYYRVNREICDIVLFAEHDILRDPPFSKLDFITCRNVLIYMDRDLQEEVLGIFHYGVWPRGYLFLGKSESVETSTNQFSAVDKEHHLYRSRGHASTIPTLPTSSSAVRKVSTTSGDQNHTLSEETPGRIADHISERALHQKTLEAYAPPSLLVDEGYTVIHLSDRAGRYIQHSGGTLTSDVTRLVRPELRPELRTALYRAFENDSPTVARPVLVQFNGNPTRVYLTVRPAATEDDAGRRALILFDEDETEEEPPPVDGKEDASGAGIGQLEDELRRAYERLQSSNEEYEASREEMQAQNEELRSINEEYRSTLEELETSKEELQSLNEELETVNVELTNKVDEISRAHNDLRNLMEATHVDTLFLDSELRINNYTPRLQRHFNIQSSDRGRPISHLTHNLEFDTFEEDAREVLKKLVVIEREIRDDDGRWYQLRMVPYRTVDDRIDGVVVTFVDITDLKQIETELRSAKTFAELIVDTVGEGVMVLTADLHVQSANKVFYRMFETEPAETEGRPVYVLENLGWDISDLRRLLEEILPERKSIQDYEIDGRSPEDRHRILMLNASQIEQENLILIGIRDVTAIRSAMRELKELNETLEDAVDKRTSQVRQLAAELTMSEQAERRRISRILHDDLQQILFGIQMMIYRIRSDAEAERVDRVLAAITKADEWIDTAIVSTRQIAVDLSPPVLKSEGLADTLFWVITQMEEMHGLEVELKADHPFVMPDENMRVLLFQVIRELLFNIVKHAGVVHARVELLEENGEIVIRVIDEGRGFDQDEADSGAADNVGLGLFSVRERLALFGGRVEVESASGSGTCVTIHVPENPWLAESPEGLAESPDGLAESPDGLAESPDEECIMHQGDEIVASSTTNERFIAEQSTNAS